MVRWLILPSCSGHVCNQQASLRCTVKALAAQAIAVWVLLRTAYCPSARTPWSLDVTAQQENITHRKWLATCCGLCLWVSHITWTKPKFVGNKASNSGLWTAEVETPALPCPRLHEAFVFNEYLCEGHQLLKKKLTASVAVCWLLWC